MNSIDPGAIDPNALQAAPQLGAPQAAPQQAAGPLTNDQLVSPPPQQPAYQADYAQAFGAPLQTGGTNGPGHFDYTSSFGGTGSYNPTAQQLATPGYVNPYPAPGQLASGPPATQHSTQTSPLLAALMKRFGSIGGT